MEFSKMDEARNNLGEETQGKEFWLAVQTS